MQITIELPDELANEFLQTVPADKQTQAVSDLLINAIHQQMTQASATGQRSDTHPILSQVTLNYDPTEPLSDDEWSTHV
ncbi:hypothetical protein [Psychrobacter sp. I-STPA10]|uniref:hypothetical protein n=1 Tax=Psychrobacter sp. I-STPA10 TaxID=2585769 RepID=UPI001E601CE7|nr:hypothetical protein [Psychrobacter sp. I-STPA10]